MTATSHPTIEECDHLNARLTAAEEKVNSAIGGLPADHPLVIASRDLLAVHGEVRTFVRHAYEANPSVDGALGVHGEEAAAAIQIERDAHTLKPEFKDVVKALFMWKDAPEERVKGTQL